MNRMEAEGGGWPRTATGSPRPCSRTMGRVRPQRRISSRASGSTPAASQDVHIGRCRSRPGRPPVARRRQPRQRSTWIRSSGSSALPVRASRPASAAKASGSPMAGSTSARAALSAAHAASAAPHAWRGRGIELWLLSHLYTRAWQTSVF